MAVGQQWKHGWIPLSPVAMRQKNHGRSVKAGSWVTKLNGASVSAKHMDTFIRAKANKNSGPAKDSPSPAARAIDSALNNPEQSKAFSAQERASLAGIRDAFASGDHAAAASKVAEFHSQLVDKHGTLDPRTSWAEKLFRHADSNRSDRANVEYWRSGNTGKFSRTTVDHAARARNERQAERAAAKRERQQQRAYEQANKPPTKAEQRRREQRRAYEESRSNHYRSVAQGTAQNLGGGTSWKPSRSVGGGYYESRKFNGTDLSIRSTPNGNFKYYVGGKYGGTAKTAEAARAKAEQKARGFSGF